MTRPFRSLLAVALIAHLLAVAAIAVAPQWHEKVHHDAHNGSHECAVTLFMNGALHGAAPAPTLPPVALRCVEVLRLETARDLFPPRLENAIRERAPPRR
ncbi:MAG TPA: hypothetical protein VNQ90_14240 [Chthoniobacteraceae bacterium]|nr:hypothetical protein [Chthoniobacteraceae bacterium]